ncbi:RloB family protein [Tenacibaculum dicentrarchi]|nr:RloB family protein [Tenacibaculum dicentrarchi]MCD8416051.1 RloB family protein [Tenacibaculum dicentrarchi]MCD8421164.1 RloB family protein [Tenacibaculum dicentrarchi]MCD8436022.1 RloB family protein [Tenacibaculum dicentrarchi]MCD8438312.1 RloB family protein [Tenacibaculum dicentrarchi]
MKMKDKKADQIAKRKKHLENLKSNRRNEPVLDRNEPSKLEKPTILIVCEGKNTEPSYFRQFKLSTATIKPIGEGYNTVSLVNRAIQLSKEKPYEQVWCVFDKDDFNNIDFNNAIQIAEANNFGVAYSNQAFEYWVILHFNDHQGGGMNRDDYNEKINELLKEFGTTYDGKSSKIITDEIFDILEGIDTKTNKVRRDLAIERAKRNYAFFDHTNYAKEESSTTVFKLVEELIKYI